MKSGFRVAAITMLSSLATWGQMTRGFISGTIEDPSAAAIEGSQVRITNRATNIARETISNDAGVYRFAAVEPGTYTIEFSKAGFETRRINNIEVGTTQEVVLNQSLAVAGTATTIHVQDAPPGVELAKSTPTVERTFGEDLVEKLPVIAPSGLDRDVTRLALLVPTVNRTNGQNGFAASGQRSRNNNFTIDGVDNNDLMVTLPNNRIIPESVSQVQVQSLSYSAEFGRNSGAQVSVITKSGSNQFHGRAFNYHKGNWMEPVSVLNKRANIFETPRFVQNDAGGALGGPVIRDRTFFFGLVETSRFRGASDSRGATPITIPTARGYAALSEVPLGANQTTESRRAILDAIAFLPEIYRVAHFEGVRSVPINGVPVEVGSTILPIASTFDLWTYQVRADHRLTDNDSLIYRAHIDKRTNPDSAGNLGFGSRFTADQNILGQNHALSHIRPFSPRLVNEFRFSYARRNLSFPEKTTGPTISVPGQFTIGGAPNFPAGRINNTFQWQEVASYLVGRHSLKMGADIRRNRTFNLSTTDFKGTFTFGSLADFVNNSALRLKQAVNTATWDARQTNQFYFFQDDVKVTKNLTLNLGLRYEYSDVPFGFFGAASDEIAAAGVPRPARADKNNWAPRGGFAYSPAAKEGALHSLLGEGQTVFRGGYGIGYDVLFYNILNSTGNNFPRISISEFLQPDTQNLYPNLLPRRPPSLTLNPRANFVNTPEDIQNPAAHFYSFTIQRLFKSNYIAEIGYVGSRSYHQLRQGQTNPAVLTPEQAALVRSTRNAGAIPPVPERRVNPNWGSRLSYESTALAKYNAMFLRFDKKMSNGLLVGANYTYSSALSDNDEAFVGPDLFPSTPHVPQDYGNYRAEWSRSQYDRPHRFVIHYSYDVPWFSATALNGPVLKQVFRGWSIAGFTEAQSGEVFSIRTGVDSGGTGEARGHRPDYNPGGILIKDPVTNDLRTFTIPLDGTGIVTTPLDRNGVPLANVGFGNLGRNAFRTPGLQLWHITVAKEFDITERIKLSLRNDVSNLFNRRNWGSPVTQMNSPAFGQNITFDPGNRTMYLSAHVKF